MVDLMKNAEDLIWIDRSQSQIVISVSAIVEVEPADHSMMQQPSHDLLDILCLIVVARVYQDEGLGPRRPREQESHPPVRNVGVIERRFKRLVLDKKSLPRIEFGVS